MVLSVQIYDKTVKMCYKRESRYRTLVAGSGAV